jgi:hypothetical protein
MRSHILHHTAILSVIEPFSPSYGHSLDKTGRGVGGWSTRRIVDRHHRMTLDGKGRGWKSERMEKGDANELHTHSKSN